MIVRAWRGRASAANKQGYVAHFRSKVLPELRHIDGFLGASLLRAPHPGGVEFLVLTRWRSMDAIRAFAGDEVSRAVVEPGAGDGLDAVPVEPLLGGGKTSPVRKRRR